MTLAHSYAEALSNPEQVTELALHLDANSAPPPPGFAAKFQHLTKLSVHGPVDGSIDFPAELFELPIDTLELGGFHAYEIFDFKKTLRHFELSNHFLRDDIGPLLKNLTGLTSLTLRGVMIVLTPFELPATIARLEKLEQLSLESLKMTNLPNELANLPALRSLTLRKNKFEQLPAVVTQLRHLTTLRVEESLTQLTLPDEFSALTQLEELSLRASHPARSFEEFLDTMFEEDESKRTKVPQVLGALPNLQRLDLSDCELTDLGGLEALSGLRELNLEHNSFRDLNPVQALTSLKRLNMSHCSGVKRFRPLESLPLEHLEIEGSHLRDLPVLLRSQTLQSVKGDAELNAAWARRAEFKALGSTDALRQALVSDDFAQASKALESFCNWVDLTSTRDSNSVASFFELKGGRSEEEPTALVELSTLLTKHGGELHRDQLLALARALFQSTNDNFIPTLEVVERLVERRDTDGQLAFVEVFEEACEFYDAGHRFFSSTVQDVLIDRLFPQFEGEALARLLLWCADDYLLNDNGLDAMDALFKPAFERVTSPTADRLLERFLSYVKSLDDDYRDGASQLRVNSPIASINTQLAELFNQ